MDRYRILKTLGSGSSGTVVLVQEKATNTYYVMKQISLTWIDEPTRLRISREVNVLHSIDHPNIVRFRTCFVHGGDCNIVMERCESTLEEAIEAREGKPFSAGLLVEWFTEMLCGVAHLHAKRILHRDIKSSNIFLSKKNHLKIGDFGVCKTATSSQELVGQSFIGTPYYIAPEVCEGSSYDERSDIWSLGIVFYEVLALRRPFDGANILAVAKEIMTADIPPIKMEGLDPRFFDIVKVMLRKKASDRPTAQQLLDKFFVLPTSHPSHPSHTPEYSRKVQDHHGPPLDVRPKSASMDGDESSELEDTTSTSLSNSQSGNTPPPSAVDRKLQEVAARRIATQQVLIFSPVKSPQPRGNLGKRARQETPEKPGSSSPPSHSQNPKLDASVRSTSSVASSNKLPPRGSALNSQLRRQMELSSAEEHNAHLQRIKSAKSKVNVTEIKKEMQRKKAEEKGDLDVVHYPNHFSPTGRARHYVDPASPDSEQFTPGVKLAPRSTSMANEDDQSVEASKEVKGERSKTTSSDEQSTRRAGTPAEAGGGEVETKPYNPKHTEANSSQAHNGSVADAVISMLTARGDTLTLGDIDEVVERLNAFKVKRFGYC